MGQTENSFEVQTAACNAFMSVIEYHPKLMVKMNLVLPSLQKLMEVMSLFPYTFGEAVTNNSDLARFCVDRMAQSIPSAHFFEPCVSLCIQVLPPPFAVFSVVIEYVASTWLLRQQRLGRSHAIH